MIHLTKYSVILFIFVSSLTFPQKLSSLEINQNYYFDDSQYLQWSGLQIGQPYFKGIIDTTKSRIAKNLLAQGFYFFKFVKDSIEFENDSTEFKIILNVAENQPITLRNIFIESDSTLKAILSEHFDFLKGEILNKDQLETNIDKALSDLENSGYPFAAIVIKSINVFTDSTNNQNFADLYLKLLTGNKNKIDKIELKGNTSTKDYVIIRELRLSPDEIYSQKKIEQIPKRLNRLGFFEPVPVPQYYLNSKGEGVLEIVVKEKNTNNFDGIIGYIPPSQNETKGYVTGLVNVSLRNLFGTGRAAAIRWNKFSRSSQELELKYLEPWLFSLPLNINLNLYQKIQDSTYVQRRLEAALEYLATENISASVIVSTESVIPTERTIPVFTVFNSSYLSTGVNFKIDSRDDPYSPTEGILFINSYLYSRKSINGPAQYITSNISNNINLQRFSVTFSTYFQFFNRQVVAINVNARELRGASFENSDLYKLGGTNSLRGYREEQFLGSRIFWSNLEYRFLFTRRTFGFLFFDTGYYLRPEDYSRNIARQEDFLYGFGLGLNIETGIGVLAVSYALGKGDNFSDGKIHFGIVNEF